jgi:hypothetical protein
MASGFTRPLSFGPGRRRSTPAARATLLKLGRGKAEHREHAAKPGRLGGAVYATLAGGTTVALAQLSKYDLTHANLRVKGARTVPEPPAPAMRIVVS